MVNGPGNCNADVIQVDRDSYVLLLDPELLQPPLDIRHAVAKKGITIY
jgi:hypothetical protein